MRARPGSVAVLSAIFALAGLAVEAQEAISQVFVPPPLDQSPLLPLSVMQRAVQALQARPPEGVVPSEEGEGLQECWAVDRVFPQRTCSLRVQRCQNATLDTSEECIFCRRGNRGGVCGGSGDCLRVLAVLAALMTRCTHAVVRTAGGDTVAPTSGALNQSCNPFLFVMLQDSASTGLQRTARMQEICSALPASTQTHTPSQTQMIASARLPPSPHLKTILAHTSSLACSCGTIPPLGPLVQSPQLMAQMSLCLKEVGCSSGVAQCLRPTCSAPSTFPKAVR